MLYNVVLVSAIQQSESIRCRHIPLSLLSLHPTLPTSVCVCYKSIHRLCATLGTVAHQATLSMGFSRQELLEWVAIPSSRGGSQLRDQTMRSFLCVLHWQASSLPLVSPGKPHLFLLGHHKYHTLMHIYGI